MTSTTYVVGLGLELATTELKSDYKTALSYLQISDSLPSSGMFRFSQIVRIFSAFLCVSIGMCSI